MNSASVLSRVFRLAYRGYYGTIRFQIVLSGGKSIPLSEYSFSPVLFAFSERDTLVLAGALRFCAMTLLVAKGKDGDLASWALCSAGSEVVRGSTLHSGALALRGLIRSFEGGNKPVAICVDGPIGPVGRVQPGVIACARRTGMPIIPLATAAHPSLTIPNTWSEMSVPLPGGRATILFGQTLQVPPSAPRDCIRAFTERLQEQMAIVNEQARKLRHEHAGNR